MVESTNPDYWNAHWAPQGFPTAPLSPEVKALLESKNPADRVMQSIASLAGGNPAVQTALNLHINGRPNVPVNAKPFLESEESQPSPEIGDLIAELGKTAHCYRAWVKIQDICSGFGIFGQIGRGKTVAAEPLAIQSAMQGATVVVLDFKSTWRRLYRIPELRERVVVLSCRDLLLSIGQPPPGCDKEEWWSVATKIWGSAYGRLRANQPLFTCMANYYREHGQYFKLSEILEIARELTRAPRNYQTDLIHRLVESLDNMYRESGDMYEANASDMPEQIISTPGRIVIIEEHRAATEHTQFLAGWLISWAYRFRRSNQELRGNSHPLFFFLEDASCLLDPKIDENTAGGVSPIASIQDVAREFGIGLVALFHSLKTLSPKIARNINSWVAVGVQGEDVEVAKRVMGLNTKQAEALLRLSDGEAVGLIPSVNPRPVFFTYPMLEVPNS